MNHSFFQSLLDRVSMVKKEAVWVFIGQIGMAIGTIMSIKLMTHVLHPSEFGRLMLANTIVVLIQTNLYGPFTHSLMRFWSISVERQDIRSFDTSASFFMTAISGIVLVGIFGILMSMAFVDHQWSLLVIISLLVGAIIGLSNIRIYTFMAARHQKLAALFNSMLAIGKPLAGVLGVKLFYANAEMALSGFLFIVAAIWAALELYYSKMVREIIQQTSETNHSFQVGNIRKDILTYAYPFFIWGIFSWIYQFCDRWALQTYFGPEIVGAFAVISQLAMYPLIFFSGFLINLFLPVAFQKAGDLNSQNAVQSGNKILFWMVVLYVFLAIGLISIYTLCHRLIVTAISSIQYLQFSYLLPWLTVAWSLFYLGQILAGFGYLANKPKTYIPPIVISGLAALTLSFYLPLICGPTGIVWALTISGLIYGGWFSTIALRLVKTAK